MPPRDAATLGRCQFRCETARCVFVDGHPGAHVGVRGRGSIVPIRGEGEIPDATYLWRPPPTATGRAERPGSRRRAPESAGGLWTDAMIRRLLEEIHEAGASSPHDWVANLSRLRAGSRRTSARTKRPG